MMQNKDSMQTLHLGLSDWIIITVLSLVLFLSFFTIPVQAPPPENLTQFNKPRLEAFKNHSAPVKVVAIGDSMLKYATEDEEVISNNLTNLIGQEVNLLRLISYLGVFYDFTDLLEAVTASRPSLIVIQDSLLYGKRSPLAQAAINTLHISNTIRNKKDQFILNDLHSMQFLRPIDDLSPEEIKPTPLLMKNHYSSNKKEHPDFIRFTEQLKRLGISYIIVQVPQQNPPPNLVNYIKETSQTYTFNSPNSISYHDGIHMTPSSRKLYSTWFTTTIEQVLNKQP